MILLATTIIKSRIVCRDDITIKESTLDASSNSKCKLRKEKGSIDDIHSPLIG